MAQLTPALDFFPSYCSDNLTLPLNLEATEWVQLLNLRGDLHERERASCQRERGSVLNPDRGRRTQNKNAARSLQRKQAAFEDRGDKLKFSSLTPRGRGEPD